MTSRAVMHHKMEFRCGHSLWVVLFIPPDRPRNEAWMKARLCPRCSVQESKK